MMFTTHLHVGNYLYDVMLEKEGEDLKLNRWQFIYGNIKPDIGRMVLVKHQFAITGDLFVKQLEIIRDSQASPRERSVALGVVTHFICDYFCKFHTIRPYESYSKWNHFWYEWKLHFKVVSHLFAKRRSHHLDISDPRRHRLSGQSDHEGQDVTELVGKIGALLKVYRLSTRGVATDMDYALYAINETFATLLDIELFTVRENENYPSDESLEDEELMNAI